MRQTAIGLQHAHDLGMVHRDIKPANLLVQKQQGSSAVKILDFGLARLAAPEEGAESGQDSIETEHQSVMGTPDYLSPEQARSLHAVDGRSDLYSLGCTFYFLLTGKVPFSGGSTVDKLVRHTAETAPLVRALRPDAPVEIEQIVAKLMAKDPAERFQSGAELAAALSVKPPVGESGKWVQIAPRAVDAALRSADCASRLTDPDPWANLEHDQSGGLAHTLAGQSGHTTEAAPIAPIRLSGHFAVRLAKKKGGGWAGVVLLFVVAAVVAGTMLAIRHLMKKAG